MKGNRKRLSLILAIIIVAAVVVAIIQQKTQTMPEIQSTDDLNTVDSELDEADFNKLDEELNQLDADTSAF